MLFGPIGAIIGGRSKEKISRTIHSYLIFTYTNNNEIKYIAFDCTGNKNVHNLIKEFNSNKPKIKTSINL